VQEESERRTTTLEKLIKGTITKEISAIIGQPVKIELTTLPNGVSTGVRRARDPNYVPQVELPHLVVTKLKNTLIKWLQTRDDLDKPVLACGSELYSPNQMIKEVERESKVGLEHVRIMLDEFEYSLELDTDASPNNHETSDADAERGP